MFYGRTSLLLLLTLSGCSLLVNPQAIGGDGSIAPVDASEADAWTDPPMDAQADARDGSEPDSQALDSGQRDSGIRDSGRMDTGEIDSGRIDPCSVALNGDAGALGFCRVVPVDWRTYCPAECSTVGCWGTYRPAGDGSMVCR